MRDNFHGDDPSEIWQNQLAETSPMSLILIRQKARELQTKKRREIFGNIAAGAIVLAVSAWGMMLAHDSALRLIFALAIVWALAGQFFLHHGMRSDTLPGDAALSTGLEFCRRELQRRRSHSRRALQWGFAPVALSIGALILAMSGIAKNRGVPLQRMMPFCVLVVVWIIALFVLRLRSQRELQREIDELNNIDTKSGL